MTGEVYARSYLCFHLILQQRQQSPIQFMFPPILKFVPGFGESFCLAPKGKLKNTAFVYRFLAAAGLNSLQIVSFVSANTGRPERRTRSQKTEFEE